MSARRLLALADPLTALSPVRAEQRPLVEALASLLRERDDAVHSRVLRELYPDVERWAFRRLGPSSDLEDAIQECLGEIASALHRFEGRSSISTLAYRITMRTVARHRKRRSRRPSAPARHEIEVVDPRANPEQEADARDRASRLLALLDELPAPQREAFVMCVLDERTPTEAAAIAGCKATAMRVRLHRARATLRALLERRES